METNVFNLSICLYFKGANAFNLINCSYSSRQMNDLYRKDKDVYLSNLRKKYTPSKFQVEKLHSQTD